MRCSVSILPKLCTLGLLPLTALAQSPAAKDCQKAPPTMAATPPATCPILGIGSRVQGPCGRIDGPAQILLVVE